MKKLFCALLSTLILLCGCAKEPEKEPLGSVIEISAQDCMDWMDNEQTFFVFIGQDTCTHCAQYREYLSEYQMDHAFTLYYVNSDAEENEETFDQLYEEYLVDLEYTPTTYYIENGTIRDSIVGELDSSQLEIWFTRLGLKF